MAFVCHVNFYFLQKEHLFADHGLDLRHRPLPKLVLLLDHLLAGMLNVHTGTLAPTCACAWHLPASPTDTPYSACRNGMDFMVIFYMRVFDTSKIQESLSGADLSPSMNRCYIHYHSGHQESV